MPRILGRAYLWKLLEHMLTLVCGILWEYLKNNNINDVSIISIPNQYYSYTTVCKSIEFITKLAHLALDVAFDEEVALPVNGEVN